MKIDNKTQFFRPLQTPLDNITSYYRYCWGNQKPWMLLAKLAAVVVALVMLVGDITDFIDGSVPVRLLIAASLLLPAIFTFLQFAADYEKRFTGVEAVPGAYDDVQPHDESYWERIDLTVRGVPEPVFRSDQVDDMLWAGTPIPLERNTDYEQKLRRRIRDEKVWGEVYRPFLRHNYRAAMYQGKQFYNEQKYGLSSGIDPEAPKALVHKTCYFDTYLTNIIPGQRLTYNRDQSVAADASVPDFMPYRTEAGGVRRLYRLGDRYTANELGVTTLLIMPSNHILLWRQNRLAQCSSDLLVASGSGSADWEDCESFIGDADGLRKAVICGMERELWEESNGSRANDRKRFIENVETRITGYFRWLKKGGKSEFVGVSRLNNDGMVGSLSPEYSEVIPGEELPADTIAGLVAAIDRELYGSGTVYASQRCSVSCTMALYCLRRVCVGYCRTCPHYDTASGHCAADRCNARPYEVLFAKGPVDVQK